MTARPAFNNQVQTTARFQHFTPRTNQPQTPWWNSASNIDDDIVLLMNNMNFDSELSLSAVFSSQILGGVSTPRSNALQNLFNIAGATNSFGNKSYSLFF